ncbi:unnamed protein product [Arabidopsis halleri]
MFNRRTKIGRENGDTCTLSLSYRSRIFQREREFFSSLFVSGFNQICLYLRFCDSIIPAKCWTFVTGSIRFSLAYSEL